MENVFSYLSVCYHRLPYRLLILGLVAVDLLCTVYVTFELPPFTGGYNFLTDDRVVVMIRGLRLHGGFINVIISIIWFHFNKDIISNVEVELNLLGVNFVNGAAVTRLLIITLMGLDLFCTVYVTSNLPPFLGGYKFLTYDRVVIAMRRLRLYGGLINVIISIIWFYFNRNIISNVEVELNLLDVNLYPVLMVIRSCNELDKKIAKRERNTHVYRGTPLVRVVSMMDIDVGRRHTFDSERNESHVCG
ncbi:unnamed protein product [Nezara viridula]|uniref:Uncharacterized protein n=1 Tax=Nezara viridula TaxID=85310 RepID=A0A9P0HRE8_NEZVI|nr:unnamed protein product [Nezara viridula]